MFVAWEYITLWYTALSFCKRGKYVSNERYSNYCKKLYKKIMVKNSDWNWSFTTDEN